MKRLLIFATLAALALLLAITASATTIRPMTIEQLTDSATHVIEGRAVEVWCAWDDQHREILTYTRFSVVKTLKGAAGSQVVVAQLGGTVNGITVRVAGIRHFQVGETALVFLRPGDTPDAMAMAAMQGNFRVGKDSSGQMVASNGVPETSALSGSQVVPYSGRVMPLTALEDRVRRAVSR